MIAVRKILTKQKTIRRNNIRRRVTIVKLFKQTISLIQNNNKTQRQLLTQLIHNKPIDQGGNVADFVIVFCEVVAVSCVVCFAIFLILVILLDYKTYYGYIRDCTISFYESVHSYLE